MYHDLSSPQVLTALASGNVRGACELMNSCFSLTAMVVHGNHLGRTMGFPTANLEIDHSVPFVLAHGVYAVKIKVNDLIYNGMANAGIRPTLDGKSLSVEINLFDFSGDLYGKTIVVDFIDRIREERKFNTLDELVQQIHIDKKQAVKLLSRLNEADANTGNTLRI